MPQPPDGTGECSLPLHDNGNHTSDRRDKRKKNRGPGSGTHETMLLAASLSVARLPGCPVAGMIGTARDLVSGRDSIDRGAHRVDRARDILAGYFRRSHRTVEACPPQSVRSTTETTTRAMTSLSFGSRTSRSTSSRTLESLLALHLNAFMRLVIADSSAAGTVT